MGLFEAQARAAGIDVGVVTKDVRATLRGWLHHSGNTVVIKLVAFCDDEWQQRAVVAWCDWRDATE